MTMVADRSSITRELENLINQQIRIFKRDAGTSDAELADYGLRSEPIRALCRSLSQASYGIMAENS